MKTPEEIKKGLEICGGYDCRGCPYDGTTCDNELYNDALAYIQQLEQRIVEVNKTSPRWISVKERQPEPFTNVLGYIPNNDPFPPVRECFRVCVGDADSYYFPVLADYNDITQWMEMPKPPKEED